MENLNDRNRKITCPFPPTCYRCSRPLWLPYQPLPPPPPPAPLTQTTKRKKSFKCCASRRPWGMKYKCDQTVNKKEIVKSSVTLRNIRYTSYMHRVSDLNSSQLIFVWRPQKGKLANSADPDQMPQNVAYLIRISTIANSIAIFSRNI